ncbi:MAG: SDR family NAD(P)-dependent oxidoreductase [Candidatus Onthovivens sp.]
MKKYTLITGSTSGLGKELSYIYAKNNNNLILVSRNEDELKKIKEDLIKNYKVEVLTLAIDLSIVEDYHKITDFIKENDIFVNNLVNNAGFGDRCDFIDMDINKQIEMTNVNCNAPLYLMHALIKDMLKNNEGHIINISSIAAFIPGPYMVTYHATKGYLLLLSEGVERELKGTNVHLLTVCPGPFESNFVKKAHNDYTFSKIKPVSAKKIAEIAYNKSNKNKRLVIVGFKNKLTIFVTRFFSRHFVTCSSAKTIKK